MSAPVRPIPKFGWSPEIRVGSSRGVWITISPDSPMPDELTQITQILPISPLHPPTEAPLSRAQNLTSQAQPASG
jgi:hypothetical protein